MTVEAEPGTFFGHLSAGTGIYSKNLLDVTSVSNIPKRITLVVLSHSVTSDPFVTPWTVACQAPLSMVFSRQVFWSELQFPLPGNLPDTGIEPTSPVSPALAGQFFTTEPPGKPNNPGYLLIIFFSNGFIVNIIHFDTLIITYD